MNKPTITTVSEESIPEVLDFKEAQSRLENWKEAYPGAFEELREILEMYNATGQAAEKVVRAKGVTCADFRIDSYSTSFDPDALYDAVGREKFMELGGTIGSKPVYDIDKKIFEANVAQGKVASDIVKAVVKHTPRYKVPKPVGLP